MTSWDAVRLGKHTDRLDILDHKLLEKAASGRCRRSGDSGRDMEQIPTVGGFHYKPVSMAKLRRLGLVHEPAGGETYRLTEAGDKALQAWRDSRANPTQ